MSWIARSSVERPYVLVWVLFCCWVNGWVVTGILAVAENYLPMFLVGAGIPRTLYANLVSLGLLAVFVVAVVAELRALRRLLPRLDGGEDTSRTRRLTALAGVGLLLAVPLVTETTGVDPFSVVVVGVPPALLLVEQVVIGVVGTGRDEPTANAG
jgi:hypothetical protein